MASRSVQDLVYDFIYTVGVSKDIIFEELINHIDDKIIYKIMLALINELELEDKETVRQMFFEDDTK